MGSADNITENTLAHLSLHWNKPLPETKLKLLKLLETQDQTLDKDHHLKELFEKAARAWGQPVEEAKKNTYTLLKKELNKD